MSPSLVRRGGTEGVTLFKLESQRRVWQLQPIPSKKMKSFEQALIAEGEGKKVGELNDAALNCLKRSLNFQNVVSLER